MDGLSRDVAPVGRTVPVSDGRGSKVFDADAAEVFVEGADDEVDVACVGGGDAGSWGPRLALVSGGVEGEGVSALAVRA